ncbi:uncharacterized protein LOC133926486 [Phragmites australis]|uniref:uncharacterized protein LOC133926486 n=1 Tax=Phragmites australis TaxID=29695 RepID=UPI002D78CC9A|nr:uncharacterized protein LOC133926486 [Phragmites australis]
MLVPLPIKFQRGRRVTGQPAAGRKPGTREAERANEMESLVPRIIALALGAGALGGADALRLLIDIAGRSPLLDIAVCIFVIGMVISPVLGTMLLARFVRKARHQAGAGRGEPGASATDCFAKMTLLVSLAVAFLVTACLLVASGGLDSLRLLANFAGKRPIVAVLIIGAAAVLSCTMPLLRFIRETDNEGGAAHAERATERFATTSQTVYLTGLSLVAGGLLLVMPFIAHGGHDALRLFPGFTNMFVAVATVVGSVLVVLFSRMARNAGGGAAPTPATDTRRFGKLTQATSLAVVSSALAACLLVTTYAPPEREPEGAKYPCCA